MRGTKKEATSEDEHGHKNVEKHWVGVHGVLHVWVQILATHTLSTARRGPWVTPDVIQEKNNKYKTKHPVINQYGNIIRHNFG